MGRRSGYKDTNLKKAPRGRKVTVKEENNIAPFPVRIAK